MTESQIRVLIVEDHQVVADGLELALNRDAGLHVVGTATTRAQAVQLAHETKPQVVLMDYHLPDGTGADAAREILGHRTEAAVVVLTADASDEALLAAVEAGACGFLAKSQAAAQVVEAVHRAAEGEMLIPASRLVGLLGRQKKLVGQEREREQLAQSLTQREREVLTLMARGMDNRAIADQLVVGYTTIRTHVQNVLDKLGAHSKLEAVARANEYGLL